jgi:hypothetical protein
MPKSKIIVDVVISGPQSSRKEIIQRMILNALSGMFKETDFEIVVSTTNERIETTLYDSETVK